MKHNGDNDASLKPRFLPDITAAHSQQPLPSPTHTHTHTHTHPCLYRWTPSHLFEREHVLSCWGESFHFLERFVTRKKSLLFPADLDVSQSPHPHGFFTRASLFEKGFKVRGLQISIPWFPWTESGCNNYSSTPSRQGWCPADTFPRRLCCCSSEAERIVGASPRPQPRKPSSRSHKAFFPPLISRLSGVGNTEKQRAKWLTKCTWAFAIIQIWTLQ